MNTGESPMPGQDDKTVEEHKEKKDKLEKAIRQLEKHIKRNPDGTFELQVKSAQEANIDPEAFDQLQRSLEEGNKHIQSGKIRADEVREKLD
jgi:hypothetical protein